jgi:hypothetical protein
VRRLGPALHRVWHVDELDRDPEPLTEVVPQHLNPEPFGRVVPGGEVVDPRFTGDVHHPLGGLAGEVGVEPGVDRRIELALGAAADDPERRDRSRSVQKSDRGLVVDRRAEREQPVGTERLQEAPTETDG